MSLTESVRDWIYLDASKQQKGPLSSDILMRMLEKGIGISDATLIWRPGMEQWKLISDVEYLLYALALMLTRLCLFHRWNPSNRCWLSSACNGTLWTLRLARSEDHTKPGQRMIFHLKKLSLIHL